MRLKPLGHKAVGFLIGVGTTLSVVALWPQPERANRSSSDNVCQLPRLAQNTVAQDPVAQDPEAQNPEAQDPGVSEPTTHSYGWTTRFRSSQLDGPNMGSHQDGWNVHDEHDPFAWLDRPWERLPE